MPYKTCHARREQPPRVNTGKQTDSPYVAYETGCNNFKTFSSLIETPEE
jgi:hypothetical protein